MGKFQLKKPRIITKHFPEVEPHIDRVNASLETFVFKYDEQVEKALKKKHVMMGISTLVLVIVIGSFISPKGRADIATFYPETCLGGWSNPQLAEKKGQTSSNSDSDQFSSLNAAILDKDVQADIYCGNFQGEWNDATTPKKIIVSLAITNKAILADAIPEVINKEETIQGGGIMSSSTLPVLDTASTSFLLEVGTTYSVQGSSSQMITESREVTESKGVIETITTGISETLQAILSSSGPTIGGDTDTVIVPVIETPVATPPQSQEPVAAPVQESSTPSTDSSTGGTSFLESFIESIAHSLVERVFAQESITQTVQAEAAPSLTSEVTVTTETTVDSAAKNDEQGTVVQTQTEIQSPNDVGENTTQINNPNETSVEISSSALTVSTSSELTVSSTTFSETNSSQDSNSSSSQAFNDNAFLEVLYTFDGVTWSSLGELDEVSMKYRTFEIPLQASSTWNDMSKLQIKITTKNISKAKPYVYLDAIQVDVLYEGEVAHAHPDFVRDTIIKDETIDDMRIVTLINYETNEEEIWYMYLDAASTTTHVSSSSVEYMENSSSSVMLALSTASSTTNSASSAQVTPREDIALAVEKENIDRQLIAASSTLVENTSTTTDMVATTTATSTTLFVPTLQKNVWYKLERRETILNLQGKDLVTKIKALDEESLKQEAKEDRVPDFALDIIKNIKSLFLNAIIVQIEKDGVEELWIYDLENNTKHKIEGTASSTKVSVAKDMAIGMKDSFVMWVSEDKQTLFVYNIISKSFSTVTINAFDSSLGERPKFTVDGLSYQVIINGDHFVFYRDDTGEVFSDDNNSLSELFRKKLELDTVLDTEEIRNLSLPVTESLKEEE